MSYWYPDGEWYPLFVTADLPVYTINTILAKPTDTESKAGRDRDILRNLWVLIEKRDQAEFQKPSTSAPNSFSSDFIGATVQEITDFVQAHFPREDIANVPFGILDTQSGEDHSILCLSEDFVSMTERAELRVLFGGATKQDEALFRIARPFGEKTDEDFAALARSIDEVEEGQLEGPILSHELQSPSEGTEQELHDTCTKPSSAVIGDEEKPLVRKWVKETAKKEQSVWIGLRFPAENSMCFINGLFDSGALYHLLGLKDRFD